MNESPLRFPSPDKPNDFKKICFFPLVLLLFFSFYQGASFAADMSSGDMKSNYDKAISHFDSGEFEEAYRIFSDLSRKTPSDMNINFYLGRSAYETGDYETAIFAFDRMLINDPSLQRVKLEMARAYLKLGSYDEAERLFNEVLSTNPPQEVQDNILLYMENISSSRKSHIFRGSLLAGGAYDDNAYAAPVSETIKIPSLDDIPVSVADSMGADHYYEMAANLGYSYILPSALSALSAEVQTYHTRYDEYDDLDLDYFVLKAGPLMRFEDFDLELFGTGSYMNLDQGDYFSGYGLGCALTVPFWSEQVLFSRLASEKRDFNDLDDRDVYSTVFDLGVFTPVLGFFDLKADLAYTRENADAGCYSFHRGTWNIVFSKKLIADFTASLGYTLESSFYDADEPSFLKERQDDTHFLRVGLSWKSGGKVRYPLEVGIIDTYVKNDSNIDLYEYEKNTVRFFTAVSF